MTIKMLLSNLFVAISWFFFNNLFLKILVDYILKDPKEKERLHIEWTPLPFPQRYTKYYELQPSTVYQYPVFYGALKMLSCIWRWNETAR